MKALKIILITIGSLAIILIVLMWIAGFFTKMTVIEKQEGGYTLVGKDFVGPYSKTGCTMENVDSMLRTNGIECTRGFGVYYDNPNDVPQDKLRSFVGNIIEEKDLSKLDLINNLGLKIDSIQIAKSLVIEYPICTSLSYMVGPMKAYPILSKYTIDKCYAVTKSIEIYDIPAKKIFYIMQIE